MINKNKYYKNITKALNFYNIFYFNRLNMFFMVKSKSRLYNVRRNKMDRTLKISYAEVQAILDILGKQYKNKVPQKILNLIYYNRDDNYKVDLNLNSEIDKMNISRNALIIISILNLKYWESNEEKKAKLKKIYYENEQVYQKKINRYKSNNWLEKDKKIDKINEREEVSLIIKEEQSIWSKIKKFIKNIFNKWKREMDYGQFYKK